MGYALRNGEIASKVISGKSPFFNGFQSSRKVEVPVICIYLNTLDQFPIPETVALMNFFS